MSVTVSQTFRNSFGDAIPILTPLYGLKCDAWQFVDDGEVEIGSDLKCRFPIPLSGVENRHCTLTFRNGALSVRRNQGRVWINDIPVGQECALVSGDILAVGPRTFEVGQIDRSTSRLMHPPLVTQAVAPVVREQAVVAPRIEVIPAPSSTTITASAHAIEIPTTTEPSKIASIVTEPITSATVLPKLPTVEEPVEVTDREPEQSQNCQPRNIVTKIDEPLIGAELDDRRRAIEARELQLLELSGIVRERERSLAERQQMLEEKNISLSTQKASLEKQKADCEILEKTLRQQKADMDGRLSTLMERELDLAGQYEASATAYSQMEQSRLALAQQLDDVGRHAAALSTKQAELELLSNQLKSDRTQITAQSEELNARLKTLTNQEKNVEAALASLTTRERTVEETITARMSEIDTRQKSLEEKEAAIRDRDQALVAREQETGSVREQLESLRNTLLSEKSDLDLRVDQLAHRSATLDARAAEIEALKLSIEATTTPNSSETRTVEQLAAIVSERESAIRAKQDAFHAMAEVNAARQELASEEARVSEWKAEIDSRHRELADRIVAMKVLRRQLASRNTTDAIQPEQASSMQDEWQKLAARHQELDVKEAQIDKLQANALSVSRAAEAEREALQNSHKDLFCERNSLMQLSQDLQSRAAGLHEREAIVQHQMDELRSRFDALHLQTTEFNRMEAELDARSAEFNRRVAEFSAASEEREQSKPQGLASIVDVDSPDSALATQVLQLSESLREMESERNTIVEQRDALMTAVRELQKTMQNAQSDVEEAGRVRTEFERQESRIQELYQTIEEKSNQLQLAESRFLQANENLESLQVQVAKLIEERDRIALASTEGGLTAALSSEDSQEALLLSQVAELRNELGAARNDDSHGFEELQQAISEKDQIIAELTEELQGIRKGFSVSSALPENNRVDSSELDEVRSRLERMGEVLRDRDDLIRELRARLIQQSEAAPAAESIDRESLQLEALELDRRATLLDKREAEIREQARRVAQSEDDVENQRRQLLDARQQLELARAEIQVAMKHHGGMHEVGASLGTAETASRHAMTTSNDSPTSLLGDSHGDTNEADHGSSSSDLRAELANLFGLKKPAPTTGAAPAIPPQDFFDLSEPAGAPKAVSFHFEADSSCIIQTPPPVPEAVADVVAEPAREENSDDFVRDYMEQLLSRSRKSAGNTLPEELKAPEEKRQPAPSGPQAASSRKSEPAPEKKASEKKGPKTKSFIEQYMAGGFGDLTGDGSMPEIVSHQDDIDPVAEETGPAEPRQPRAKIDRQKLRENMDSFRTLSTQSVENALVNHALRQEQTSINGRIMFIVVLIGMSAFLAIANAKGVIQQPSLIWVTLVAAIAAGAELARKYYSVRVRTKGSLVPDEAAENSGAKGPSPLSASLEAKTDVVKEEDFIAAESLRGTKIASPESTVASATLSRPQMNPDASDDNATYFEL